jgi:hypothetical protein
MSNGVSPLPGEERLGEPFPKRYSKFIPAGIAWTSGARLRPAPVRMPLPPADHQGSIYENQRASGRRYFATPDEAPRIAAE